MTTSENSTDLTKYRYDLEAIRETAAQVIKDFGMFSIPITFSGNEATAYQELKNQLVPELLACYEKDYARLQSLFYRIDLSEKKVNALKSFPKQEMIESLAGLILERELIKVITRKLYKKRNEI